MLAKLRSRLTYANVMATLGVFIALGGTAYAVNTVNSSDIVDGQVKSVDVGDAEIKSADVKDESLTTFDVSTFLGADVVDESLTGNDIAPNTIQGGDIALNAIDSNGVRDGSLADRDIGENKFIFFAAAIGVIPANGCVIKDVTGTAAAGDHLLLTASGSDALSAISYDAITQSSGDGRMAIKACNPTTVPIDDGTTHFNLLVIRAT
jgi:hypothetical protein